MRIDPVLGELRSDPNPQFLAQRAVEQARDAWFARPDIAAILEDLSAYGAGQTLVSCTALETLMASPNKAKAVVAALMHSMGTVLREYPIAQIPFRHQFQGGTSVLQLAETGRASLSLLTYQDMPEAAAEPTKSLCFSGGERHEIYLAGKAQVETYEVVHEDQQGADLDWSKVTVQAGDLLDFVGANVTRLVRNVAGRLVVLRLGRSPANPLPAREFSIPEGRLLHRASGDRKESQEEMAMALLCRMQRTDVVPALEKVAFDGSGHLRWEALRSVLALDTGRGFNALQQIACDERDPLSPAAGALRAQLLESYPQLQHLAQRTGNAAAH